MSEIHVAAERTIGAPPSLAYAVLADYREHHPKILPDAFSDFEVEEGGVGSGTVIRYTLTAGGRKRTARAKVDEPEPGRILRESDVETSIITTFHVTPAGGGTTVRFDTRWQSASGIGGFFERTFAPRVLRRLYAVELERLDRYTRELSARAETAPVS